MSHLDLFTGELPDRDGLPVLEGRPPFLRRKSRKPRLELVEQPPCRECGGRVGPVTRMCAACHFEGWWPPVGS